MCRIGYVFNDNGRIGTLIETFDKKIDLKVEKTR